MWVPCYLRLMRLWVTDQAGSEQDVRQAGSRVQPDRWLQELVGLYCRYVCMYIYVG